MAQKHCTQCGHELDQTAKFCPECGTPVNGAEIQSRPEPTSADKPAPRSTGLRDTAIVVGLVIIVSAAFFVFKQPAEKPHPPEPEPATMGHAEGISTPVLDNLPQDYETLVSTGNQFMDEGNFPMAAEIYSRALGLDGSSPDVRTDYGACLHAMGLPHRALEEFREVLATHPEHAIVNYNMGIVYYGLNQPDSARAYFEKFVTLDPQAGAAETARNILKELGG